jgi:hypothetical protein
MGRVKVCLVVFILLAMVVSLGMAHLIRQDENPFVTKADAFDLILAQQLHGNANGTWVYGGRGLVQGGSSYPVGSYNLTSPMNASWFFFIDDHPGTPWEHPCRYVFVDLSGNIVVHEATTSPASLENLEVYRDDLISGYETTNHNFLRIEIKNTVSYWHQRMVDGAIVEGDYINYQFDTTTQDLLKEVKHWREDVPESIVPMITQEQAEALVEGNVLDSQLYILAPDSVVFPIEPTPTNPCWVVWSRDDGILSITVIDAMEGDVLGSGISPSAPIAAGPGELDARVQIPISSMSQFTPTPNTSAHSSEERRQLPGFEPCVAILGIMGIAFLRYWRH